MVTKKDDAPIVFGRFQQVTKPIDQRRREPAGWADTWQAANQGNVLKDRKAKRIVARIETYDPPEIVLQAEEARLLAVAATFSGARDSQIGEKEFEVSVSIGI